MNTKSVSTLLTAIIVISIICGITVFAIYPTGYSLATRNDGTAEISTDQSRSGPYSVKMATIDSDDLGEIEFTGGPLLNSINALSWHSYTVGAGTFGQLTAWMGLYLHEDPGKTIDDWYDDYFAGSPKVYYIQAEPYARAFKRP